jgi:hypothetical protein
LLKQKALQKELEKPGKAALVIDDGCGGFGGARGRRLGTALATGGRRQMPINPKEFT